MHVFSSFFFFAQPCTAAAAAISAIAAPTATADVAAVATAAAVGATAAAASHVVALNMEQMGWVQSSRMQQI